MIFYPPKPRTGSLVWLLTLLTGLATLVVLGLSIWTAWGRATLRYDVTPAHLAITFGPSVVEIDRDQVRQVSLVERPTRGRRHVGTNMPGLKQGTWSFEETGRITLYATTTDALVVIETADRKWGISPEDPQAFMAAVASGGSGTFAPVRQSATGGVVMLFVVSALLIATTVSISVFLRRLAGTMRYEIGPDALRIYGGWRPIEVPYRAIESVSIENPSGVPLRIAGVGMPGLHWGPHQWKAVGPGLRLYSTRLKPLVVVRAGRRTYGLSPERDTEFVDELSRKIRRR